MHPEITAYNDRQTEHEKSICELLARVIDEKMPEADNKIWHRHPVWFLEGNPIVGYSKLKAGIRLMFWSGMGFNESALSPGTGKFKDASRLYTNIEEINVNDVIRWLEKSKTIQWDYKNIVKRKGQLIRLK